MNARDQLEPIEKASKDELLALQLERLKNTLLSSLRPRAALQEETRRGRRASR